MRYVYLCLQTLLLLTPSPLQAASPKMIFTYPACLSECSGEDLRRAQAESATEKLLIAAIDSAEVSVDFAVYTFSRRPLFEALLRATERGIRVRGLVDRAQFGSLRVNCRGSQCDFGPPINEPAYATRPLRERLQSIQGLPLYKAATQSGKLLLLFHGNEESLSITAPPGSRRLMHHKYLLIDRRKLFTGSGNWSSTAISVNFENIAIFGPNDHHSLVKSFACNTDALWAGADGRLTQLLAACQAGESVFFTPSDAGGISSVILTAISKAQESVRISMHHLTYTPLLSALHEAVTRGVRLEILFDDDDCLAKTPAAIKNLQRIGRQSVAMRYLPTSCALFQLSHNKYGIFDGRLVINGSANWSKAGLLTNYENFQLYEDAPTRSAFMANFAKLWTLAKPKSDCGCRPETEECRTLYCLDRARPRH